MTVISDTHSRHDEIDLPAGDLLIHCGDMLNLFDRSPGHLQKVDEWFARQKFDRILCIGGNHDRLLQTKLQQEGQPFRFAQCLTDDLIEYRGLQIFGSPWVPDLRDQAFFKDTAKLVAAWAQIPADLDILITHAPPKGILDVSSRGKSLGCPVLAEELKRISPRVHCFGHVHASSGMLRRDHTLFINAASLNGKTGVMRRPVTFGLSPGGRAQTSSTSPISAVRRWLSKTRNSCRRSEPPIIGGKRSRPRRLVSE